jgi:hypothetical protein
MKARDDTAMNAKEETQDEAMNEETQDDRTTNVQEEMKQPRTKASVEAEDDCDNNQPEAEAKAKEKTVMNQPVEEAIDMMPEATANSKEEYKWVKRFISPVDYKCNEDDQAKQAVELYKDYMKMVDGRKKRHTEREYCRLWWAWIVLKRRHERRQRASATKQKRQQETSAMVSTPPRKKTRQPESPSNHIDELKMAINTTKATIGKYENIMEEFHRELKRTCLKRKKVNLERWFRVKMIEQHKIGFQKVLIEVEKGKTPRQIMRKEKKIRNKKNKNKKKEKRFKTVEEAAFWEDWEGWESDEIESYEEEIEDQLMAWINWCEEVEAEDDCLDNNQPTVTTEKSKQYTDMERKYLKVMAAAQRALTEATIAVETPFYWFRDETMDDVDNNYYFWHRGRPLEGDY